MVYFIFTDNFGKVVGMRCPGVFRLRQVSPSEKLSNEFEECDEYVVV
jgi:hypothetical protein